MPLFRFVRRPSVETPAAEIIQISKTILARRALRGSLDSDYTEGML
jgi:hypothetical protein